MVACRRNTLRESVAANRKRESDGKLYRQVRVLRNSEQDSRGTGREARSLRQLSPGIAAPVLSSANVDGKGLRRLCQRIPGSAAGRVLGALVTPLRLIRTGGAKSGREAGRGSGCRADKCPGKSSTCGTFRGAGHTGIIVVEEGQGGGSPGRSSDSRSSCCLVSAHELIPVPSPC